MSEAKNIVTGKFWFTAFAPQDGGIMFSNPEDPLFYVWQTREQAEEIIALIQAALMSSRQQSPN